MNIFLLNIYLDDNTNFFLYIRFFCIFHFNHALEFFRNHARHQNPIFTSLYDIKEKIFEKKFELGWRRQINKSQYYFFK